MKIINLGHACFKVEGEDASIIFDPYHDNYVPNLSLPKGLICNQLFISHEHEDHNARELIEVKNNSKIMYETIEIPHDKNFGKDRGMNKIHIVYLENFKIVHLGDIGVLDISLLQLNNVDVLFVPINGFYTISSLEAIQLIKMIKPKIVIPMHYYNKDNQSGYHDGNQIDIFKHKIGAYKEIYEEYVNIKKGDSGIYIFNKARQ